MVVRIFLLISLVSLESTGVAASAETIPCGINGECPNNLFCCGPPIGCWDNDHCPSPPYLDCPEKKTVGDTCYEIDEYNYPQDNSQYGCNLPCTYKKVGDHGDEKFCFKQPGLLPVTKGCTPEQITTEVGFCGDQNFTCQAPNTKIYCCSPNEICGCFGCWWRGGGHGPVCPACPDPKTCPDIYEPICGVNNVTYPNKCWGCKVFTACNGECPCKGICETKSDCPTGETCCPPENNGGPGLCRVNCPGSVINNNGVEDTEKVKVKNMMNVSIFGNITFQRYVEEVYPTEGLLLPGQIYETDAEDEELPILSVTADHAGGSCHPYTRPTHTTSNPVQFIVSPVNTKSTAECRVIPA